LCFSSNTDAEHHTDGGASGNHLYGTTCDGDHSAHEYTGQTSSYSNDNGCGDDRGIFYNAKPGFCRGNFQDGLSGVPFVR
jgi:hypothetical protein